LTWSCCEDRGTEAAPSKPWATEWDRSSPMWLAGKQPDKVRIIYASGCGSPIRWPRRKRAKVPVGTCQDPSGWLATEVAVKACARSDEDPRTVAASGAGTATDAGGRSTRPPLAGGRPRRGFFCGEAMRADATADEQPSPSRVGSGCSVSATAADHCRRPLRPRWGYMGVREEICRYM